MKQRFYIHCPTCMTRMVRTGYKEVIGRATDHARVHRREYQCGNCGRLWMYDELRKLVS